MLAPFTVQPRFVSRIWGSEDLSPWYHPGGMNEPIGEVWLTGDDCQVSSGPYAGETLAGLFARCGAELLGVSAAGACTSPLLLKVIFARDKLSVQVHPDDAMAQKYGFERGKTECWYALAAEEGAQLACGLLPGTTLETLQQGIAQGSLEESLQVIKVHAGEMVYIDAGTVHAIWPGSILLETQQNCDLTYRMYDYGRPRELHVERSLEAVRFDTQAGKVKAVELADRTQLIASRYFRVERMRLQGETSSSALRGNDDGRLSYLFVAQGSARITGSDFAALTVQRGGVLGIPARCNDFSIATEAELEVIRIIHAG
jgi:mannose-6-phosphate isomerase